MLQTEFPAPPAEIEAALERDGEWRGDVRHINRRGEVRWVAAQWVMQKRAPEASARVVEIANDITDLKQKDDALRDSEDRLTQALATYSLGILDYNLKTGKAVFSPELEHIAGLAHGALGDDVENWFALKPLKDRARTYSEVAADAKSRKPQSPLAVKILRSDGELRELHGMRRYVYDRDGDLERVIGIYMDVTEQVRDRAELTARDARLRELQSELTHVSRLSAMGEMGAALAHELNQPLTAIGNSVGAIGMMLERDGPLEPPARERILRAARHTEGQAVRAGEIVRRLREFIARGEADSRAENLASLIVDAVALAIPTPLATNVEVRERFSPKVQEVLADRIQIQQVMVNLIRNALEAMRQQATPRILTISTAIKGSMAEVCVYDNGPGVSPEVAERLFSPFVSTKSNGMGVGLSICLRIVEAHGGKMWAARSPGGGAAFHFTLPLIRIEARHGPQTARASG
jgi:signal transduction histidine kinase